ncbi:6-bladed beta-propeller [bacterium]|nr:6-bladed beta-propeller [bacterium]
MRTILALFLALSLAFPTMGQTRLELQFGNTTGKLSFSNSQNKPDGEDPFPLGPLSFRIDGDTTWVADSLSGKLLHLDHHGNLLKVIETIASGEESLVEDFSLEKDSKGAVSKIWVANGVTQVLTGFSSEGKKVQVFGGYGKGPGKFLQINRIEIGSSGRLYVADKGRQKISIFSADGKLVRELPWQWSGFCLDESENIYFLRWDEKNRRINLVVESIDGAAVRNLPLDLEQHLNPDLWYVSANGETVISYMPAETPSFFKLARISREGYTIRVSDLKIPLGMNRFIAQNDKDSLWLVEADFELAPQGSFKIIRYDIGGTPEG